MKRLPLIVTLCLLFSSCSIKYYPLKGQYPTTPIIGYSDKSFDKVWDNLVDLFAQYGLPIKLIDKNSGLIVSEKMELVVTYENKDGKLIEPNSMIVVPTIISANGRRIPITGSTSGTYAKVMTSNQTFGEWNVRVKRTETGTSINVNITNVSYKMYSYPSGWGTYSLDPADYKSTGLFENRLSDILK